MFENNIIKDYVKEEDIEVFKKFLIDTKNKIYREDCLLLYFSDIEITNHDIIKVITYNINTFELYKNESNIDCLLNNFSKNKKFKYEMFLENILKEMKNKNLLVMNLDNFSQEFCDEIYTSIDSNIILVTNNFNILEKHKWLKSEQKNYFIKIKDNFTNYCEFYRKKSLENKPKILEKTYNLIISKIISCMNNAAEKGKLNCEVKIDGSDIFDSILHFFDTKDQCTNFIFNKILDDNRFKSEFFDLNTTIINQNFILDIKF